MAEAINASTPDLGSDRRFDRLYFLALAAVAARNGRADDADELRTRAASLAPSSADAPSAMDTIERRLDLSKSQTEFLWTAAAFCGDPRFAIPAAALIAGSSRRGLTAAVHAEVASLDPVTAGRLATWLDDPANPLRQLGLVVASQDVETAVLRPYCVPPRVLAFLRGDMRLDSRLNMLEPAFHAVLDATQEEAIAAMTAILRTAPHDLLYIIEGVPGSGRRSALASTGQRIVSLDAPLVDPRDAADALVALRREAFLIDAIPAISEVDALFEDDQARKRVARIIEQWDLPVVVTTNASGLDLQTRRPTVRTRWNTSDVAARRELWSRLASAPSGDLEALAHRYRIGPGGIGRAVASARTTTPMGHLSVEALERGVRHNIAEKMGTLARRVEVSTTWSDLVLAEDTADQLRALIARVRHAPTVLGDWGFGRKVARGGGVAALFSGRPGTGKTMCAGLVANELGLDLYQVDLSQIVSKWIGETEKQLARVFDAAEEGHGLLLFDEADALFGQRSSEMKGATDRYANLEVNFLLQRIEAFSGIAILTTNLDAAIDAAFKRRLAAHLVFDLPDEDERARLWRRHVETGTAPIAGGLDYDDLARTFPKMSGANIRNAAVAAAFLAADSAARRITQELLHRAARIEYRAMGHVLAEQSRRGSSRLE
jgi:AAA+ superfamily predicted ATPase